MSEACTYCGRGNTDSARWDRVAKAFEPYHSHPCTPERARVIVARASKIK